MSRSTTPWLLFAAGLAVAGGAGYGLARLTAPPAPEERGPAPAAASDQIVVPPDHLQVMGIAVAPAITGALSGDVSAPGTVVSDPGAEASAATTAAGSVSRILVALGQSVRAGQPLIELTSREAAAMAADRSVAAARAERAQSALAREQRLFDAKVTPRQDLEAAIAEAKAAEAELRRAQAIATAARLGRDGRTLVLSSPISGRVSALSATLGQAVAAETELARVADPARIQVQAAIPATDAPRVRPGDPADVIVGSQHLPAEVVGLTPGLDPETRAAKAVLRLKSRGDLVPGVAAQVRISPRSSGAQAVLVPDEAVQVVNGREVVFLRTAGGFRIRPVVVAARSGGRAALASGLASGQAVATRNAFLLKAEATKATEDEE